MNPERWRQVDQLFQAALERAPEERTAFISKACGGDDCLRCEVEALLAADGQGKSFIEHPAYAMGAPLIVVDDMRSLLGKSIGHYQITSLLGKGGMGEVYRARDPRLGREVAIKVLPREYSADADRLRRFEQEARAAGMLNHPNILTIYDVGAHDGAPYLVSELLEGATLREQLRGSAAPLRRALDYAVQMARGLAAAHEKGIVHRDLKPENLFITKDGRLKILDFGLAKLRQPLPGGVVDTGAPPLPQRTAPGVLMGTIGYMSPEQVRAEELDQRSDIFACGAILYEMLAGQRAFRGASAAEMMNAILKEEPPELSQTNPNVAPAIERVMRRCLEKSVEERFQSALDLAFALEALSGVSASSAVAQVVAPERPGRRLWLWPVIALLIVAVAALAVFIVGKWAEKTPPEFQRLSFRRGMIWAARFAPDNQTVIYSAKWQGEPHQIYSTRPESPESRPLDQLDADLLAISASGELAIALLPSHHGANLIKGTLAQMSLTAIAPRPLLQDVIAADWASDGKRLAIAREVNGRARLEFPIGTVLYEPTRQISKLRISPTGEWIAFDEGGTINVVDLAGKKKTLSRGWQIITGLVWSPGGNEVWFTAPEVGFNAALYAVTLSEQQRLVTRIPHSMRLFDISRDGRVLLGATNISKGIKYLSQGETQERDLSWLDWGHVADISADGKMLLFTESGEGGGAGQSIYLRKTDGSPAIQFGAGIAQALSPDGKWALTIHRFRASSQMITKVMLLPIGAGEHQTLTDDQIFWQKAIWFPNGKRILLNGNVRGQPASIRSYILDLEGGKPSPITTEGTTGELISPDGQWIITIDPQKKLFLFPVAGGESHPVAGQKDGDEAIRWSADGRSIYVRQDYPDLNIMRIYRLNLSTGRREQWKEYVPADPVRIAQFLPFVMTPNGKSFAYTYAQNLIDLYLVKGLR